MGAWIGPFMDLVTNNSGISAFPWFHGKVSRFMSGSTGLELQSVECCFHPFTECAQPRARFSTALPIGNSLASRC
jgi:hypothetical protein